MTDEQKNLCYEIKLNLLKSISNVDISTIWASIEKSYGLKPTIKTGHWNVMSTSTLGTFHECSCCKGVVNNMHIKSYSNFNYCPYCGADMREGAE